jgi:hypothetical protein
MIDRAPFLEVLPSGEKVGKLGSSLGTAVLRVLGHPESPLRAIRAKCADCCGGSLAEVRRCTAVTCPLWPMRMGKNPFYGLGRKSRAVKVQPE